jgi:uncharacterized pyridoxal phosphate-containing UPF0001 family protein
MNHLSDNLSHVQARIAAACQASARAVDGVHLLAVSKTFGADDVLVKTTSKKAYKKLPSLLPRLTPPPWSGTA